MFATKMNLGDPMLELIDPTPDVHSLFVHFDRTFFWGKLESKTTVRWSKRMYSSAGVCSYFGRAGCDIALSEPLLKLRPRKDLIETLLHEMIHALLFLTDRDTDRDGHGPKFQAQMHRINKCAGLNISIYHSFHEEVQLYQTHWWRCNGPCQRKAPHFGIVRRSMNRAPGPSEYWWKDHLWRCGGKFHKIKEPPPQGKKTTNTKPNADITKYVKSNNGSEKPVLKDSGNITPTTKTNSNKGGVYTIGKKGVIIAPKPPSKPIPVFNGTGHILGGNKKIIGPKPPPEPMPVFTGTGHILGGNKEIVAPKPPLKPIPVFTGTGHILGGNKQIIAPKPPSKPIPVVTGTGHVLGGNKKITTKKVDSSAKPPTNTKNQEVGVLNDSGIRAIPSGSLKHKTQVTDTQSPPTKTRKIDDYFNSTAILKDLYGDDYKLKQTSTGKKLVAVKLQIVDCPICSGKFNNEEINRHLDECLNKDMIEKLTKDGVSSDQESRPASNQPSANQPQNKETVINTANISRLKEIVGNIPPIPTFKPKAIPESNNNEINREIRVTGGKTNISVAVTGVTPEDVNELLKTPVPAFNPFPSLPENTADDIIDLTSIDFDTRNINTVNTNKDRRKTASEATLSSQTLILNIPLLPPIHINSTINLEDLDNDIFSTEEEDEVVATAGSSKVANVDRRCPICTEVFYKSIEEHLDECSRFFTKNTDTPEASTDRHDITFVEDEDDILDETQTLNATGTKTPCPCCMKMVEQDDMHEHLDGCLEISLNW